MTLPRNPSSTFRCRVAVLLTLALSCTLAACSGPVTSPHAASSPSSPAHPSFSTAAAMPPGMSMATASSGSSINLASESPAGDITLPTTTMAMAMAPGMQMAGPTCTTIPTTAQQAGAVALVNSSWQDSSKYRSLATATAAGYRPITPTGQPVVHYLNPAYYHATITGGPILNLEQPQSLVYANTPHGAVLAAAMYIAPRRLGAPPQPGGCLTQWHIHTKLCIARGAVVAEANPTCPAGSVNRITPPMLHIWFVPIPGGPTAVDAPDTQVVHAAQEVPPVANPAA